jgi:hypothetical protein
MYPSLTKLNHEQHQMAFLMLHTFFFIKFYRPRGRNAWQWIAVSARWQNSHQRQTSTLMKWCHKFTDRPNNLHIPTWMWCACCAILNPFAHFLIWLPMWRLLHVIASYIGDFWRHCGNCIRLMILYGNRPFQDWMWASQHGKITLRRKWRRQPRKCYLMGMRKSH